MALLRGLVSSLFIEGHVETTLARAKAAQSVAEKLLARARHGELEDLKLVAQALSGKRAFTALRQKVVPALPDRGSGYTKMVRVKRRRGDGSVVARLYIPGHPALRELESARE